MTFRHVASCFSVMRSANDRPLIGVSSCLLGESVRYDGSHKQVSFLTDILSQYCDFSSVCPEMAIGLGVPRPPIQLVGSIEHPKVLGVADASLDVTEKLIQFSQSQVLHLSGLSGYIFKKGSPSCGMERVKVQTRNEGVVRKGVGVFARLLMTTYPLLPVIDETYLIDPVSREGFIKRVYVYQHWQQMIQQGRTMSRFLPFEAGFKYV